MEKSEISVRIFRFDPKTETKPTFSDYKLPYSRGATILGVLRYIYENVDRTLAFRDYHCAAQICGGCRVKVNGKVVKACNEGIQPGAVLTIEPFDRKRVIRDLAVFFD